MGYIEFDNQPMKKPNLETATTYLKRRIILNSDFFVLKLLAGRIKTSTVSKIS
jgi:hypothetical protein